MTSGFANTITEKAVLEEIQKINNRNLKVLDLGCGDGELSKKLKNMGFDVYAADITVSPFKKDIKYKKFDFNKGINYPKNHFDIIISMEVIEHMENPWFFIDEIYRITKPSGKAIITTPNPENYISRLLYLTSKRFVSFGPDLSYWHNSKKMVLDKHKTPIFHVLFREMVYGKFIIERYISNGVLPVIECYTHLKNPNIGLSKIYVLKKMNKFL